MATTCRCETYDRLKHSLRSTRPPLRIEDLVRLWASENYDELVKVAFRTMQDPPGTAYTIAPLTFIAFATERARGVYHGALFDEIKRRDKRVTAQQVACLHTERLILWCRQHLEAALAGLAVEVAYQSREHEGEVVQR